MKNEKYCAAVASVSWLTDAAYPLRVHTVFLRFPNFELSQKSRLGLLAKLCGVALKKSASLKGLRIFGDPERTRTVDLQRDRLAC